MCTIDELEKRIVESNNHNVSQHIEIHRELNNVKEGLLGVQVGMGKLEGKVTSAGGFSKTQKVLLSIAGVIIITLLGIMANYQREFTNIIKSTEAEKTEAYKTVIDINNKMKIINDKMDAFTGTAILDTLEGIRTDIHTFYIEEWDNETKFTKKLEKDVKNNTKARLRGETLLKDHELRIKSLEDKSN